MIRYKFLKYSGFSTQVYYHPIVVKPLIHPQEVLPKMCVSVWRVEPFLKPSLFQTKLQHICVIISELNQGSNWPVVKNSF